MSEYLIKIINRVIGILKILCWKILYGSRFHSGKMTFFYPGCHLMIEKTGSINRQFVEVLPKEKIARNLSVLKQFGLEDRILNSLSDFSYIDKKIDYKIVDDTLEKYRRQSNELLKKCLYDGEM